MIGGKMSIERLFGIDLNICGLATKEEAEVLAEILNDFIGENSNFSPSALGHGLGWHTSISEPDEKEDEQSKVADSLILCRSCYESIWKEPHPYFTERD